MKNRLLGREPVITVSLVVAMLISILPVFGWPDETVGIVAAALVVLGGAIEAALISVDRLLPLLVGIAKAVLAVAAAFGLHLADNHVSALMALLTVIAGLKVREQVVPKQRPKWHGDGRSLELPRTGLVSAPIRGEGDLGTWAASEAKEQPLPEAKSHGGERDGGGRR